MARYINAELAIQLKDKDMNYVYDLYDLEDFLAGVPTADVAEVKHGEWIDKFNRNRMATQSFCSACGKHSGIGGIESNRHKPYCPNCGAKMDGGKAE